VNPTTPGWDAIADLNVRIDCVEKKALLSALWLFNLLNHIFRGIHEIVKAEFLADALKGTFNGVVVTEAMFLLGGIMIQPPIVMLVLVWVLPLQANRWANVIVAPLFGLTIIFGALGDLDDYFHASLEVIALAMIVWLAWSWKPAKS
jgi:hypothetical protein